MGRRVTGAVVALVLVAAGSVSCTGGSQDPDEDREGTAASDSVSVEVSPDAGFRLELPDGTVIVGSEDAVAEAGSLVATPATMDVPDAQPLLHDSVSGFDLSIPGGRLLKPVKVSFPAPPAVEQRTALPVVVHVDDEGAWSFDGARAVAGRFEIVTSDFSFRAPEWLNPVEWVRDLLHQAVNLVTGRTDPPACPKARVDWASLVKKTSLLHACLKAQPDKSGEVRAEAYLKANRDFYMKVGYDESEDYTWQQDADSLFALGVKASRGWLADSGTLLVPPGDAMSVGYRRPQLDRDVNLTAYLDIRTALLSTVSPIIDALLPDKRGGFAALWALKTCVDKIPAQIDDVDGWWSALTCMFADALPQLHDEKTALAAARSILGPSAVNFSVEGAGRLKAVGEKLKLLGKAVKVLGLVKILRDELLQMIDAVDQWDGYAKITLHLEAGPLSVDQLSDALIPAGSCSSPTGGWDDTVAVQLHDGQGETQVPGSDTYVSILATDVLGWADVNGDGKREVVLMLQCAGSRIEMCCAGQSSLMNFVNAFSVDGSGRLTRVGAPFSGQEVYPGDDYGPASSSIASASLSGTTVTTQEYVLYSHLYTAEQLGGIDPTDPVLSSTWTMTASGEWSPVGAAGAGSY